MDFIYYFKQTWMFLITGITNMGKSWEMWYITKRMSQQKQRLPILFTGKFSLYFGVFFSEFFNVIWL